MHAQIPNPGSSAMSIIDWKLHLQHVSALVISWSQAASFNLFNQGAERKILTQSSFHTNEADRGFTPLRHCFLTAGHATVRIPKVCQHVLLQKAIKQSTSVKQGWPHIDRNSPVAAGLPKMWSLYGQPQLGFLGTYLNLGINQVFLGAVVVKGTSFSDCEYICLGWMRNL